MKARSEWLPDISSNLTASSSPSPEKFTNPPRGNSVCSVDSIEFIHYVFDMEIDGSFADSQYLRGVPRTFSVFQP